MTPDGSAAVPLGERVARARRLLAGVEKNYSPAAFASSFGAEDMVVLDLIARDGLAIEVFTLDTGRLPRETHELIARVRKAYGLAIRVYEPWPESIDAYVEQHGRDGFYEGVEQRKACCAVRKVEPLRRALERKRAGSRGCARAVGHALGARRRGPRPPRGTCGSSTRSPTGGERRLGVPAREQGAVERAARPRLPLDRLRAVHAGREAGRAPPRWPLVVGARGRQEGMRLARDTRQGRGDGMSALLKERREALSHLDWLESESIHILREVAAEARNPALLFSGGKDSIVMLRLAEKAFRPDRFPFPLLHIDTSTTSRR
jgi:3'-phosphoadenosine 5'-phosphosulfate sulfotransferase (PAPS reductase)/FAD synthetase